MTIVCRATRSADLPSVLALETSSDNAPWVLPWPEARHRDALSNPDMRHVMIAAAADGRTLGYAIIAGLQNPHRSVELVRLVIGVKRQGWGRAALRALTTKAFAEWGAHRFWLDVFSDNERARSLYRAEGFTEEGVLREAVLCDGRLRNLVVMSVLKPEWSHEAPLA
jgi:RimJ/RimL family protein N-acetyltransferase